MIGLAVGRIYASLTPVFLPQALAQDIANLAVAAPAMILLAVLALRGSLRAYLLWLGVLAFTVYNYVIYTFSIPFGPLFLLWVAVLGLCLYALIGGVTAVDHRAVAARYRQPARGHRRRLGPHRHRGPLWPAVAFRRRARPAVRRQAASVTDMALPTNPVHILDLAFFLPAVIATGVLLLKRRPLAYTVAPASSSS